MKYPKTMHHPASLSLQNDDRRIPHLNAFIGRRVIVTEKMDGENTTMKRDACHARSLDSKYHPSRDRVRAIWGAIGYRIPPELRVCGENMYALHSIQYHDLESHFLAFSVWMGETCLSWSESMLWFKEFDLCHVPVIYDGIYDPKAIQAAIDSKLNNDWERHEGWVMRVADEFQYSEFNTHVAKWVRKNHVQTDEHWLQSWTPEKINHLRKQGG